MNLVQSGLSVKIIPVQYIGDWPLKWYVLLISFQISDLLISSRCLSVYNVSVLYTLMQ